MAILAEAVDCDPAIYGGATLVEAVALAGDLMKDAVEHRRVGLRLRAVRSGHAEAFTVILRIDCCADNARPPAGLQYRINGPGEPLRAAQSRMLRIVKQSPN